MSQPFHVHAVHDIKRRRACSAGTFPSLQPLHTLHPLHALLLPCYTRNLCLTRSSPATAPPAPPLPPPPPPIRQLTAVPNWGAQAGGNFALALLLTVICSTLGVFTVPLMLDQVSLRGGWFN